MIRKLLLGLVFLVSPLAAMKPLPESFTVVFGREESPNQVVEYVSVGCPSCHRLFKEEFSQICQKVLIPGKASWKFHLVPDDPLSCQLALTLNALEGKEQEKRNLFAEVMRQCTGDYITDIGKANHLMRDALTRNGLSTQFMDDLETIRGDERIQIILAYLTQEDAVRDVPTVEINGEIFDDMPTYRFIKRKLL